MNICRVFPDGSSISIDEWNDLSNREELFVEGFTNLLGLPELHEPISEDCLSYINYRAIRNKACPRNQIVQDLN